MTSRARLEDSRVAEKLKSLPGWSLSPQKKLARAFVFQDFTEAFAFMTRAAFKAEALNHHPEWRNVYNRVEVELQTHETSDGRPGITELDFELARALSLFSEKL